MVMPVRVGVGDVIAVGKLVKTIASELKEVGKAAPEYRQLLVELEALERTLSGINDLQPAIHNQPRLEALRAAVMVCQRQLQDFLIKMAKFDKALGIEEGKRKGRRQIGDRVLESINRAETDRENIKTGSENLRRTSQRLLDTIQKQHDETLTVLETQNAKTEACTAELSMSRTQWTKDLSVLDKRLEFMRSIKAELQKIAVETAAVLSKCAVTENVETAGHGATSVSSRLLDIFATAVTTVGLLSLIPQLSGFGRERCVLSGSRNLPNYNVPVPCQELKEVALQEQTKGSTDVPASQSHALRPAKQSRPPKPKARQERKCSALDQLHPYSCNNFGHSSPLACPFKRYGPCDRTFSQGEQDKWIQHSLAHFGTGSQAVQPPAKMCCPFCKEKLENSDGVRNWKNWMRHIFEPIHHSHHFIEEKSNPPEGLNPSFMKYLFDNSLMDEALYKKLMDDTEETRQRKLRLAAYDKAFKQRLTDS